MKRAAAAFVPTFFRFSDQMKIHRADLRGETHQVAALIGDGALSSGMSMEALNQIGSEGRNMVIIFNDNNMSIFSDQMKIHRAICLPYLLPQRNIPFPFW